MMEPDDFRACLISMGYDLVSAPHPPPISTYVLHMDHLLCASQFNIHDLIFSSYLLRQGRIRPFRQGLAKPLTEVD